MKDVQDAVTRGKFEVLAEFIDTTYGEEHSCGAEVGKRSLKLKDLIAKYALRLKQQQTDFKHMLVLSLTDR